MTGLRWSIINILRQNNSQLQAKIEVSEKRVIDQESYINIIDQYSTRNNTGIQGILKTVKDDELESKVVDIFGVLNISISNKDKEDCYCLEKDGNSQRKTCEQKVLL